MVRGEETAGAKVSSSVFKSVSNNNSGQKACSDTSQVPQPRGDMVTKENVSPNQVDCMPMHNPQSYILAAHNESPFLPPHPSMMLPP